MQTESIESRIDRLLMGSWLSNCFHNSSGSYSLILMNFDPPYCPPFSLLHTFSSLGPPPPRLRQNVQTENFWRFIANIDSNALRKKQKNVPTCLEIFWLLAVIAQIFGHHPLQQALIQILITSSCRPCWLYQQLILFFFLIIIIIKRRRSSIQVSLWLLVLLLMNNIQTAD
jgi:hypothetical protein